MRGAIAIAIAAAAACSSGKPARPPAEQAPPVVALADVPAAAAAADLAAGRAVLLDVREQSAWDGGYVEGAVSFPWSWLQRYDAADQLNTIPADRIVYVYGDASGNARLAARKLSELGFDARPFEHSFDQLATRGDHARPTEARIARRRPVE